MQQAVSHADNTLCCAEPEKIALFHGCTAERHLFRLELSGTPSQNRCCNWNKPTKVKVGMKNILDMDKNSLVIFWRSIRKWAACLVNPNNPIKLSLRKWSRESACLSRRQTGWPLFLGYLGIRNKSLLEENVGKTVQNLGTDKNFWVKWNISGNKARVNKLDSGKLKVRDPGRKVRLQT